MGDIEIAACREIENELFFADFPCEQAGFQNLDKYIVRDWLIGYAVRRCWTWTQDDHLNGQLVKLDLIIQVKIVPNGVRLTSGDRTSLIETRN